MKEIYAAIVKAQSELKGALKDSLNPHFRNKYADLSSVWDACRDALHKNGLAVVQLSRIHESGAPVLLTRIIHSSGQHIEGEYPLVCKDPNDPQKLGSATTYARRYALAAAIGIIQEDDDGNGASSAPKPAPAPQPSKPAANSVAAVFEAQGLKYPDVLEEALGKKVKDFTDTDKVLARNAVKQLSEGKPWNVIKSSIAKDVSFT